MMETYCPYCTQSPSNSCIFSVLSRIKSEQKTERRMITPIELKVIFIENLNISDF